MKYLEKALEMNEIDAEHRERTIREYEAAKERIKNLPLTLSDDADAYAQQPPGGADQAYLYGTFRGSD